MNRLLPRPGQGAALLCLALSACASKRAGERGPGVTEDLGPASESVLVDAGVDAGDAGPDVTIEDTLGDADLDALEAVIHQARTKPEAPPRGLRFGVIERGPGRSWALAIFNDGDEPSQVVADIRLLRFEVVVPSKKQPVTCRLPESLFPDHVDRRVQVTLEPGEALVQPFDPRLYCFASAGQTRLVPGAFVRPYFGWPEKTKTVWRGGKREPVKLEQAPPFVATRLAPPNARHELTQEELCKSPHAEKTKGAAKATTSDAPTADAGAAEAADEHCVKSLEGEPFALRSEYKEWSSTRLEEDRPARENPGPLEIQMTQGSDAEAERTATVALRLKNRTKTPRQVYFRRELVSFEIMGPDGLSTCDAQPDLRAPDRQAFTQLGRTGSLEVTSRLIELCPQGAFARPGLYLVHARFDATEAGDELGLDAFVGRVVSLEPAAVRIRTGELPFLRKRAMRTVELERKDAPVTEPR
jgi:hypothetical protein